MRKRKGLAAMDMVMYAIGITLLAAMGIVGASTVLDGGKPPIASAQIGSIAGAVSRYKFEIGTYPANLEALTTASGGYGPWLPSLPASDPWNNTSGGIDGSGGTSAYCYARTATGFAIWSIGKNHANNSGGSGSTLPTAFGGDDVGVFGN